MWLPCSSPHSQAQPEHKPTEVSAAPAGGRGHDLIQAGRCLSGPLAQAKLDQAAAGASPLDFTQCRSSHQLSASNSRELRPALVQGRQATADAWHQAKTPTKDCIDIPEAKLNSCDLVCPVARRFKPLDPSAEAHCPRPVSVCCVCEHVTLWGLLRTTNCHRYLQDRWHEAKHSSELQHKLIQSCVCYLGSSTTV